MGKVGEVIEAELVEDDELDPTDLKSVFFRKVRLSEEQRAKIVADLDLLTREAMASRGDLDNNLAHWNDMVEGIAAPKNFPWPNSSNLYIPISEIHLNNVHAAGRRTMFKGDQMWYVRSIGVGEEADYDRAAKLERFLNYKTMVELPIVDRASQILWCTERDGTSVAQITWGEETEECTEIKTYAKAQDFLGKYPTPKDAGLTQKQFDRVIQRFTEGKPVKLLETYDKVVFSGPMISVIQLADFIMSPMTAQRTRDARLVGKMFTMRGPQIRKMEDEAGWKNVDELLKTKGDGRNDLSTSAKDEIEGISRRAEDGDFVLTDGIHRFDLDGDGREKRYLFTYHPKTKTLLDYMYYPYLNRKDCFVPCRIKKRPGRFLGRGLCAMLDDINSEVNTQHNQRIDSRTITTVPTFKAKDTAKKRFDPQNKQHRFFPGNVYWLESMDDVAQFDIRPTDLSESMNEESALMSLADQLTGSSQLRSGKETKADPRAPAAKVMTLLEQSDVRLDDYFEELAGNAVDNEGLNAIGEHILWLYYQFHDEDLAKIPLLKENLEPQLDASGKPLPPVELTQDDLNLNTGSFKIQMAKTSASKNPESLLLRFMQTYSLLINDPLVGGRPAGRLALQRRLLSLAREENPDQFLPKNEQEAAQAMGLAQLMQQLQGGGAAGSQAGGKVGAPTRNGQKKAEAPGVPGSTRPMG